MMIGLNAANGKAAVLSFHTEDPYSPEGCSVIDIIALTMVRYAKMGVNTEIDFAFTKSHDPKQIEKDIKERFVKKMIELGS